ncbi:MAG: hypothetical protein Q8R91_10405 [Candidatus Omnitrophota bacterium]|nr:hypothetical protein [Candidatus Omnitrophota bacterium]
MQRRTLLAVLALMLVGGFVARAAEAERSNHQPDLHHCMVCCTNHHVADAAKTQTTPQPILSEESAPLIEPPMLYQQAVIRLPDPPPKFLV